MIKDQQLSLLKCIPKNNNFHQEKKKEKRTGNTSKNRKNRKYETTSKDISVISQISQKGRSFVPRRRKLKKP
jgi:hypothetical protein